MVHEYRGVHAAVLGASGFIGRWLAHRLADAGARVTLVVRNQARAKSILCRTGVSGEILERNLRDRAGTIDLLRDLRPSIVFNLIAYGGCAGQDNADEAALLNTRLVEWIAEAVGGCRHADGWPGARLVHTGTALEYGRATGALSEDSRVEPTNVYGATKLAGSLAVALAAERYAFPALTARLFMVYGPGEPANRLVPSLLAAARSGSELALTEGTQRRDFTYVEDVTEGLLRLGRATGHDRRTVNLATGQTRTVREFVEAAARVLNIDPTRLHFGARPTPEWEMSHEPVDVSRLRALTGWVPTTSPEEGIRRTLRSVSDV